MSNPTQQTNGTQQAAEGGGALATQKREQDGAMIFLSYLWFLALVPFLTVKDSDFVRWHAKQGLTLSAVWLVLWIVMFVVSLVVGMVPVLGLLVDLVMYLGVGLGGFVLWLMALIKAFNGERWKIPLIGDLAEKW